MASLPFVFVLATLLFANQPSSCPAAQRSNAAERTGSHPGTFINQDSVIASRIEMSQESTDLFHFLTDFKFYFDKHNEFERARQVHNRDSLTRLFSPAWRTRYKMLQIRSVISSEADAEAWFHLGKFNFKKNAFPLTVGLPFVIPVYPGEEKLLASYRSRLPKSVEHIDSYISIELDNSQQKTHWLPLEPDTAERFKNYIDQYEIRCEVVFNATGQISSSLEPVESHQDVMRLFLRNRRNYASLYYLF